jgi:predicted DNA-binding transcriptional regulator YafY
MTQRDQMILEYIQLRKGIENKVSMRDMAETMSVTTRDLRESIEDLVILGYPIGNLNGYFWIIRQDELDKVKTLALKRLQASARRYSAVKKLPSMAQMYLL